MKSSKLSALLLALSALALAASANDSWQKKPSSEWSEKDLRQILEKSPWAHRVKLMVVKPGSADSRCATGNRHCTPDADPTLSSTHKGNHRMPSNDDVQTQQANRANSDLLPGLEGVAASAVVRWASARTVREAVVQSEIQSQIQRGVRTAAPDPARLTPMDVYVVYLDLRVALADVSRVPQGGVFTKEMAQNSVLVVKSTGQRISPLSVRSAPLPPFDERKELALGAFYILFPRRIGDKPSLPPGESTVRFECPTVPVPITSEFDLRKMSRDGSPDL